MALTPEDVVNKRFQPTKFREGYDQDEVDDFLDEVVVELRRLNQENEELRQRLVVGESRPSEQQSSSVPRSFVAEPIQAPVSAAPVAAAVPVPVIVPVSASEQEAIDNGNTNNLLQLARKLHEEHVREGIEKRDALIAEGHATAARVVSEAEAAQRSQISALNGEKQVLEQQKTTIEHQIDDLRTFEREYRQKLKSYIEGQLQELGASEPSAESASVPTNSGIYTTGSYDSASADSSPVSARADDAYENSAAGSGDGTQTPPSSFQGFGGN